MTSASELKIAISEAYADRLGQSSDCCGDSCGCGADYSDDALVGMPDGTVSYGCGNPLADAALRKGDTVLDLGSGAGLDCMLAAREIGPEGEVIGVDFTPEMIDRAEVNAAEMGLDNVSFRLGDIEALPVEDASVDVVISNCVINLAPDKDAVFKEAFRVLRSGGRLEVSDVVLTRPASQAEKQDMDLLTGCVSGSLPALEYAAKVRAAGFQEVRLKGNRPAETTGEFWFSAGVSAKKP